jgi:hypothetical protein
MNDSGPTNPRENTYDNPREGIGLRRADDLIYVLSVGRHQLDTVAQRDRYQGKPEIIHANIPPKSENTTKIFQKQGFCVDERSSPS